MPTPKHILEAAYTRASVDSTTPLVSNPTIIAQIEYISRNIQNRAGVRVLLACALAKVHNPGVDIRKPYTEISDTDAFSGRSYDEKYVTDFIFRHGLPCNATTAFLTPALRNRNTVLTPDIDLVGRPREVYQTILQLLNSVHQGEISADDLLAETVRHLIIVRDEKRQRIASLLAGLRTASEDQPLSAEAVATLVEHHLDLPGASRLPVLAVAAAYQVAELYLGRQAKPLEAHNAADRQTHASGDIEITLASDDNVVTTYEVKMKRVTINDIDHALHKLMQSKQHIENYIFITTEVIADEVKEYAAGIYERTHGVEVVVLDCIGFLHHFLHLFHWLRMSFLDAYQELVLNEPDSAVSQPLKEALLALRQAAESA